MHFSIWSILTLLVPIETTTAFSSMSFFSAEKEVATAAATAAAKVCQHVRQTMVANTMAMQKEDQSPVTVADFAAQAVVCRALLEAFPNDPVVAEEDADALRNNPTRLEQVFQCVQTVLPSSTTPEEVTTWIDHGNGQVSSRYWTLDPIDGTKGFLRGDQYAVALALVADGQVQVGVMACPTLTLEGKDGSITGILFVAVRGQGATMQPLKEDSKAPPQPIHVSNSNPRMVESFESAHSNQSLQKSIAEAAGITTESLRMDSQAKYGVVASGQAALYLRLPNAKKPNYKENIWDHAAGSIVLEEAGGCVTDMNGNSLDFTKGDKLTGTGVVVSNGEIHEKVLAALQQKCQRSGL